MAATAAAEYRKVAGEKKTVAVQEALANGSALEGAIRGWENIGIILTELILRWLEGFPGSLGKSQKEGQEDRGGTKRAKEATPLSILKSPGPPESKGSTLREYMLALYSLLCYYCLSFNVPFQPRG